MIRPYFHICAVRSTGTIYIERHVSCILTNGIESALVNIFYGPGITRFKRVSARPPQDNIGIIRGWISPAINIQIEIWIFCTDNDVIAVWDCTSCAGGHLRRYRRRNRIGRNIPIRIYFAKNAGLVPYARAQIRTAERSSAAIAAVCRVKAIECISLIITNEYRMRNASLIKHNSFGMIVQKCL